MNYYELGAGLALGAGFFGSIIYLLNRIKRIESQLIQARQKNVDNEIDQKVRMLSDDELDGLVGQSLGRDPKS